MKTPETTFITVFQLEKLTGLPARWVQAEAKAGRLPHVRISQQRMMFHRESVEHAILARQQPNQSVASKPLDDEAQKKTALVCQHQAATAP